MLSITSRKILFRMLIYFPAYEIMMDDLRDYRFYEADMIHPSQLAIDYIWEKFGPEKYFSKETECLECEVGKDQKVNKSIVHSMPEQSSIRIS